MIRLLLLFAMIARLSTALCPFARDVPGDNNPETPDDKLNDILKRIKEHVPDEESHQVKKRDWGFDAVPAPCCYGTLIDGDPLAQT